MSFVKSSNNCAILGDRMGDLVHRGSVDEIAFRVFDAHLSLILRSIQVLIERVESEAVRVRWQREVEVVVF
jgi:hypothetical protein